MPAEKAAYLIHNTTRSVESRTARALAPTHSNTVLLLAGGGIRVLRKRPFPIAESVFQRIRAELVEGQRHGRLKVTDLRGSFIDLLTGDVTVTATVSTPRPNFRLDSAANDKNGGQVIPPMKDEKAIAQGLPAQTPSLLQDLNPAADDDLQIPPPPALPDIVPPVGEVPPAPPTEPEAGAALVEETKTEEASEEPVTTPINETPAQDAADASVEEPKTEEASTQSSTKSSKKKNK